MKKRFFFGGLVAFLTIPLAMGAAVFANSNFSKQKIVKADNYSLTLNSTVFAMSELDSSEYQMNVEQGFGKTYMPVMNYYLAKLDNDNNLVLAPSGKIYNYSSEAAYGGRVTDITSLTINYSGGTLYVQTGIGGGSTVYGQKVQITSGTPLTFDNHPNYLMISNSNAATTITNMTVNYSCNANPGYSLGNLGETYTGMGADSNVYTLTRNGVNVSVAGQTGTIAVADDGAFTITLAGGAIVYTGTVSPDYKSLTFLDKSGAGAAMAPDISEMNRVYVMEDFESYTQTGGKYTTNTVAGRKTASGLRANYYCDYGGGGSTTWIKNNNFNYAVSDDYLNLTTAMKHSGNNGATVKGWTGGWTRAWSIEAFDQNQHYNFGSGNKFSFWTHGAYTNTACTNASTKDVKIRVQVYYQNFVVDNDNRNSTTYGSGTKDFTITAGSDWTERTFSIDPSRKVYAVNIMVDNSTISSYQNVYLPIDDLTIYTQPVFEPTKKYEQTSTSFTKTYNGTVNVGGKAFTVKVGLGANGYVYAYAGADMVPTEYSVSGNTISIVTTGYYHHEIAGDLYFGTWTGTLSSDRNTITIPKGNISGNIANYIDDSEVVLHQDNVLATGAEGTTALQALFKRQYLGSSWTDDPGNADRVAQNDDYYIEGSSCMRVRPYNSGNIRIYINPSLVTSDIESVAFWYYVPAGVNYSISAFGHKTTTPSNTTGDGNASQLFSRSYDGTDGGWKYVNVGIPSGFKKNVSIFVSSTSSQTLIDYVTYF